MPFFECGFLRFQNNERCDESKDAGRGGRRKCGRDVAARTNRCAKPRQRSPHVEPICASQCAVRLARRLFARSRSHCTFICTTNKTPTWEGKLTFPQVLFLPELRIAFDAGQCFGRQPDHVFLSHAHMDHGKDLSWMVWRDVSVANPAGVQCHCPLPVTTFVERFIDAEWAMNFGCTFISYRNEALGRKLTFSQVQSTQVGGRRFQFTASVAAIRLTLPSARVDECAVKCSKPITRYSFSTNKRSAVVNNKGD